MARRSDHSREELRSLALAAAARMAAEEGWRGLTARGVARRIGYTVGTIYNLFADLDDLIRAMNAETMDRLHDWVTAAPAPGEPAPALRHLGGRYIAFVRRHPALWASVMEHKVEGEAAPAWFVQKIERLIGLGERAIAPLFPPGAVADRRRHARVLWSALYGIGTLEQGRNLPKGEDAEALLDTLVAAYVAGLRRGAVPRRRKRSG